MFALRCSIDDFALAHNSALYARATIDAHSHRTMERGALQIQALVDQYALQSNADDASTTPVSPGISSRLFVCLFGKNTNFRNRQR